MQIVLQYFDGCPNWETTRSRLEALIEEGLDATVELELIRSHEEAIELGFQGSPTVLIDGVDPFGDADAECGLACRVYLTDQGRAGSPTLEQLRAAMTERMRDT